VPRVGRSLRQACAAAAYTAVVVGGVEVLDAEPVVPRRNPKDPVAWLAGTPWASRQLVYLARAALNPPAEPLPDPGAVVGDVVAELALDDPPQAVARATTARRGRRSTASRWGPIRRGKGTFIAGKLQYTGIKAVLKQTEFLLKPGAKARLRPRSGRGTFAAFYARLDSPTAEGRPAGFLNRRLTAYSQQPAITSPASG
jgi:hypothetical protein